MQQPDISALNPPLGSLLAGCWGRKPIYRWGTHETNGHIKHLSAGSFRPFLVVKFLLVYRFLAIRAAAFLKNSWTSVKSWCHTLLFCSLTWMKGQIIFFTFSHYTADCAQLHLWAKTRWLPQTELWTSITDFTLACKSHWISESGNSRS